MLTDSEKKTILVDTVEYDNRLLELRGNNGTMKFMLNSILIDAHLADAKKVAIFAAPYGKPINFVNYIKRHCQKQSSISHHEEYYFESVDPYNTSLHASLTAKSHYTVALGYSTPLKGVIDHGFTQIGMNRVEKLVNGNKGVFEIEVKDFITDNKLTSQIPKKEKTSFFTPSMSVDQKPEYHETVIAKRKEEITERYLKKLSSKISKPKIEVINEKFTDKLLEELLAVEKNSFSNDLRYSINDVKERLHQKSSQILIVYEDNTPIAFALSYVSPKLSDDIIYLDTIGVISEKQNLGLGQMILELHSKLSLFDGFSQIYVLTEKGNRSESLIKFYQRNGFELIPSQFKTPSNLLIKQLGLKINENKEDLDTLKNKISNELKKVISSPEVDILFELDHAAIQTIIELEKEFELDLRYNKTELNERANYKDVFLAVIKDKGSPIAFSLCYYDPSLLDHTIFFDTMSIQQKHQSKGIGKLIVKSMIEISRLSKYSQALFYCKNMSKEGINLIEFYEKLGARVVEVLEDKTKMIFQVK